MILSDPWGMDSVKTSLPPQHTGGSDSGLPKSRNLKTPEHFLGENSALVNLDNLMGPPKTGVAGVPPKSKSKLCLLLSPFELIRVSFSANNPFMGTTGTGLSTGTGTTNNPFAAQQRPSPTLNEMRTAAYQPTPSGASASANWTLQQPLQPANPDASSTNPFL
jgi:epsin